MHTVDCVRQRRLFRALSGALAFLRMSISIVAGKRRNVEEGNDESWLSIKWDYNDPILQCLRHKVTALRSPLNCFLLCWKCTKFVSVGTSNNPTSVSDLITSNASSYLIGKEKMEQLTSRTRSLAIADRIVRQRQCSSAMLCVSCFFLNLLHCCITVRKIASGKDTISE